MNRSVVYSNVLAVAKQENPHGFALLNVVEPLTFETLKQCYRDAAKKYHPDIGGTTEDMQTINTAYQQFHDLLCSAVSGSTNTTDQGFHSLFDRPTVKSTLDYLYVVSSLLIYVHWDEWAVDHAYRWLDILAQRGWANTDYALNFDQRSNLIELCCKLAIRLHTAGLSPQANAAFELAKTWQQQARVQEQKAQYHGGELVVWSERFSQEPFMSAEVRAVLDGKKKMKIILNHPRQAENARRLKMIGDNRYEKVMKRFSRESETKGAQEKLLADAVADNIFLQNLPADQELSGLTARASLIPGPVSLFSTERKALDMLSDDQKAEYLKAFSQNTTLDLVRKYTNVRLENLLRSVIYAYEEVNVEDLVSECEVLAQLAEQRRSTKDMCKAVMEFCRFVDQLNDDERRERLKLLQELDRKPPSSTDGLFGWGIEYRPPFSIQPFSTYCKIAQLPVEQLQLVLRTGYTKAAAERRREVQEEKEAYQLVSQLYDSPEGKRTLAAMSAFTEGRAKRRMLDPSLDLDRAASQVIEAVGLFYSRLLEAAEATARPDLIRVDNVIHEITLAHVQLAQWREAKEWINRYHSLPNQYHHPGRTRREMKILSERCDRHLLSLAWPKERFTV